MKNSAQIIELPIISINDGTEVGKVKSLVINPEKGTVDFLTVDHEDWQVSVRAIPFRKIIGIGEYAVTVANENAVIDLNEIPIANQLVNKKIKILNTKVITRKGQLLGEIIEYFVDEENGSIIGATMKLADHEVVISSEAVLTYGRDIIIVNDDAENHYYTDAKSLLAGSQEEQQAEGVVAENEAGLLDVEAALREKQISLLEGKRVKKDIKNQDGDLLFTEGTILAVEDIKKAQNGDPSVIVDLSMHVEA
ncbi:PRC-barrel domain-containing protein [Bacillus testis]|uniref:PRC-barrel domain-containing protein n=1 Tax=Bacillus testis TaxID=1622072 RepID=UPI00067F3124|nr:PRC-barrel domain-containing protein [Bacillus testis]